MNRSDTEGTTRGYRYEPVGAGDVASPWTFLAVLLRHRWLIIGLALLLGGAVATYVLLTPRKYSATAAFVPQEPSQNPGGLGALAAQFGLSASRAMTSSPQFYADLLESRELLRELMLAEYEGSGETPFRGDLLEFFRIEGPRDDRTMTRALKRVRDVIDVTVNRVTGVVAFEVATRDPAVSRTMVERLLALVAEYNLERRQSQGRSERQFAEQRLREARRELMQAESALAAFTARNRVVPDYSTLRTEQNRLQREVSMQETLVTSLEQNYELARLEEVRNTPVLTVLERPAGFVEPQPRGTVKKTLAAVFAGGFLGAMLAFALDFLERSRRKGTTDFVEFSNAWRQTWRRRRPVASGNGGVK